MIEKKRKKVETSESLIDPSSATKVFWQAEDNESVKL